MSTLMTKSNEEIFSKLQLGQQAIIDDMDQIQTSIQNYNEVKPKLRMLYDHLFLHFSYQNNELLVALKAHVLEDRQKSKILDFLEQDIKEAKVRLLAFVDEFPADMGDIRPISFPKKFTDFSRDIMMRMQMERQYLFPFFKT